MTMNFPALPIRAFLAATLLLLSGSFLAARMASAQSGVTAESLLDAENRPADWTMYSGQYHSQRFSRLDQIDTGNADRLELQWVRQFSTLSSIETSPLVVDGIMYATLPDNVVMALDARTGQEFWSYAYPLPEQLLLCCGKQNRGVAILGERLYFGTLDGHLVALDSKTGAVLWDVEVARGKSGYSLTSAPMVIKDMVITGIAGGEYGIRGFIDAYDVATGELRWRTFTVPGPGEPGHDSWEGDSWKTGGAATWMSGSYDPEAGLLYWGTGNPSPDWNGEHREGDNLYSDSVLALDVDTGEIEWHFQFTPHDVHDWDACQIPVLVDLEISGRERKLMLFANRNGFFYVLDRLSGEFLLAEAFVKQTWAERITEDGRPVRVPGKLPSEEGTVVYPAVSGGANWWSPTYSPETELFYTMSFDGAHTYFIGEAEYREGELFVGGHPELHEPMDTFTSAVRAIDPTTGKRVWEYRVQPHASAGLLSTAGNVVFGGDSTGSFFALDAKTGKELWHGSVGGQVHAGAVTYLVDGKQHVTIAAGHALFTYALREN